MGLDMYLTKKTYVKNWEHNGAENQYTIDIKKGGNPVTFINPKRISYIEEEVMYWRKANQIHNWFVTNIQDGNDNCGTYYVDYDTLQQLLDKCKEALAVINESEVVMTKIKTGWDSNGTTYADISTYDCADAINEIIPPTSGFFFGGTLYDEWYERDLEYTVERFEKILADPAFAKSDFYYQSSW
mgnify:CR=1 FL=1